MMFRTIRDCIIVFDTIFFIGTIKIYFLSIITVITIRKIVPLYEISQRRYEH